MVTAYDVGVLEPVAGNPGVLSDAATRYEGVAALIEDVARQLTGLAEEQASIGRAAQEFQDQAGEVAGAVGRVVPRYQETALAVREYVISLSTAQSDAQAAAGEVEGEREVLFGLYWQVEQHEQDAAQAVALGDVEAAETARHQARVARHQVSQHEEQLGAALARYTQVLQDLDAAGNRAADRIQPVLDDLNDTLADRVGAFFDDVADFTATAAHWVADVLEEVVLYLTLLDTLVVTVAVAAVMIAGMPWEVLGNPEGSFDRLLAVTTDILPWLNSWLVLTLGIEALKPTPAMRFTRTSVGGRGTLDPYQYAFQEAADVDLKGGSAKTVVQVVRVGTDVDGRPIWRVVPPSTQDWELTGDKPAANDLGSNLTLMLAPGEKAAYERMVIEAMTKAGIGPKDHVMMVGFSQGGILAGKLAADPNLPFNVEAIVVAGAPIDHMNIPTDVDVLSFQHKGDPVHRLDGQAPAPPRNNWATITTDPYTTAGPQNHPGLFIDASRHKAKTYATTAQHLGDGSLVSAGFITRAAADAAAQVRKDQAKFFSQTETSYYYEGAE